MSFLGADTDELRDAGKVCQDGKETTDQVITYLKALIAILRAASFFSGGASAAYATYLETVVVPWLQKISMALGLFSQVLNANAEAQDQASQGQSVDFGSLPTYTSQVTGDTSVQPFAGTIIGDAIQGIAIVNAIADAVDGDGNTDTATPASGTPQGVGTATSIGATSGVDGGGQANGAIAHAPDAGTGVGGTPGGGGSAGGGGTDTALGTSSIGSSPGGVNADGTPAVHESGSTAGGFGGASPGADTLGTVGHTGSGDAATTGNGSPSYGTAAAIAGGAAVAGVGGAALAARSGGADPAIDRLVSQNGRGSSGPEVRDLQQRLTDAGYDTRGVDGQWGGNTEAAYDAYRADNPLQINHGTGYSAPSGYDYNQITGVRGNANVTPEFLRAVEGVAQRTGAQPEHLMAVMSFETGGTFAADARNGTSGATGLIQFMPGTASGTLHTTTAALAGMTPTQQLPYVEQYLDQHHGRIGSLEGLYTSVLAGHPTGPGQDLFTQGTPAYAQNSGLDFDHNGVVTSDEAASAVRRRMP